MIKFYNVDNILYLCRKKDKRKTKAEKKYEREIRAQRR